MTTEGLESLGVFWARQKAFILQIARTAYFVKKFSVTTGEIHTHASAEKRYAAVLEQNARQQALASLTAQKEGSVQEAFSRSFHHKSGVLTLRCNFHVRIP